MAYLRSSKEPVEVAYYAAEGHCDVCGIGLTTKEVSDQAESDIKICDSCVERTNSGKSQNK